MLYESVFNQVSRIVFPLEAPINIQFMKFFKSRLFPVAGLLFSSFFALAQEQMTLADYQQAADYAYSNLWNKKVFNVSTAVHEFEDHSGIWFVDYSKKGKVYKTVSFKNGTVKPLFDQEKLAAALSEKLEKHVEANEFSISKIDKIK